MSDTVRTTGAFGLIGRSPVAWGLGLAHGVDGSVSGTQAVPGRLITDGFTFAATTETLRRTTA
jgi:hypothetical protein